MHTKLHYAKAPIVAAIIDLRVVPVADFDVEQLNALSRSFGEDTRVEPFHYRFDFEAGQEGHEPEISHSQDTMGYVFAGKEGHLKVQARLDGFTFSQSAPYGSWMQFRDEARRVWNEYRSLYPFQGVTRVALRYINELATPKASQAGNVDLSEFLTVLPQAPFDAATNATRGYFMQLQLRQVDLDCELIVNSALTAPTDEKPASVILDFDLFQERFEEPWQPEEDASIWDFLEQLRVRKNELFQASVTPKFKDYIL